MKKYILKSDGSVTEIRGYYNHKKKLVEYLLERRIEKYNKIKENLEKIDIISLVSGVSGNA